MIAIEYSRLKKLNTKVTIAGNKISENENESESKTSTNDDHYFSNYKHTEIEQEVFNRKLESVIAGLQKFYYRILDERLPKGNACTIIDYILAMKIETNLSDNYRQALIKALAGLSEFTSNKSFANMTREDILGYLDSFRKPETSDTLHKWIGL